MARHDRLIAAAAADLPPVNALLLAQFSMARAQPLLAAQSAAPILTAPDAAVNKLKRLLAA